MTMGGIVVIFDFDKTIVNVDTDNWVIDELGFTSLFVDLLTTMPWNSVMDRMMIEIHSKGKSIEDIVEVLKRTPFQPRVVPTIKSAYASRCELRILSDANMFFIETILQHMGIRDYFSEITSNPAYVDEQGRLRISPFHDFTKSHHACSICPPNMCKGQIIERMQAKLGNKRVIYIGDGSGDYCPSLKLTESDYLMPRKNFPIWDLITENPQLIKAKIFGWSDGKDLESGLLQIINTVSMDELKHTLPHLSSKL